MAHSMKPPDVFYVVVNDDSMLPLLNPGRVAVCDPTREPKEGDIVAVRSPQTTLLRRYQPRETYVELWTTTNMDFILDDNPDEPCEIIGVCIDELDPM